MRKIPILVLILANAAWAAGALKVLQSFGGGGSRGGSSLYAGLIRDASGNLYGAAESGGTFNAGVVYKLSPTTGGGWTETKVASRMARARTPRLRRMAPAISTAPP